MMLAGIFGEINMRGEIGSKSGIWTLRRKLLKEWIRGIQLIRGNPRVTAIRTPQTVKGHSSSTFQNRKKAGKLVFK